MSEHDPRIAKLPAWARDIIHALRSDRDDLLRQRNLLALEQHTQDSPAEVVLGTGAEPVRVPTFTALRLRAYRDITTSGLEARTADSTGHKLRVSSMLGALSVEPLASNVVLVREIPI